MTRPNNFPKPELPWSAWEALPMSARIGDRLGDILVIVGELRVELTKDQGGALNWIAPEIDSVAVQIDTALQRLSS